MNRLLLKFALIGKMCYFYTDILRNFESICVHLVNRMEFRKKSNKVLPLLLALILCGCGYRFGQEDALASYSTITIPYIEGDHYGEFTTAVIKRVAEYSNLTYNQDEGDLILKIKILEIRDQNIGFRYDRNKKGQLIDSIIPSETRLEALAELQVIDAISGCLLIGPVQFSASTEFDHDYYSSRNAINIFSLGQLIDYDAAYDTAMRPLSQSFAEKVVDILKG